MARIDDANRRILTKKFELGLFERPLTDRSFTSTVGNAAHRTLARQAVRESQVLLKNAGNVLPLATAQQPHLRGRQERRQHRPPEWRLDDLLAGRQRQRSRRAPRSCRASATRWRRPQRSPTTQTGAGINNTYNVAIAVVGETPYAEGAGDRPGSMGLDTTDLNTINTLRGAGVPVVVVLVSGRPMDIASQLPNWNALVAAWLPGTEGQGVADVLFGVAQPTGKLPMTWMNSVSQQPINDGDGKTPLFPYGFGLTYGGPPPTRDAYAVIQAESYNSQSGTQVETTTDTGGGQNVGFIAPGDWLAYERGLRHADASFGHHAARLGATASGTIQYRLDSTTGPIVASVPVSNTGGWQTWGSVTTTLSGSATGVHRSSSRSPAPAATSSTSTGSSSPGPGRPATRTCVDQAESYSSQSGTQLETTSDTGGGQNVGWIAPGDWLAYSNVDFGTPTALTGDDRDAPPARPRRGTIQYRLDSRRARSSPACRSATPAAGRRWGSVTTTLSGSATGVHTLYITFTGTGGDFININWFQFAR